MSDEWSAAGGTPAKKTKIVKKTILVRKVVKSADAAAAAPATAATTGSNKKPAAPRQTSTTTTTVTRPATAAAAGSATPKKSTVTRVVSSATPRTTTTTVTSPTNGAATPSKLVRKPTLDTGAKSAASSVPEPEGSPTGAKKMKKIIVVKKVIKKVRKADGTIIEVTTTTKADPVDAPVAKKAAAAPAVEESEIPTAAVIHVSPEVVKPAAEVLAEAQKAEEEKEQPAPVAVTPDPVVASMLADPVVPAPVKGALSQLEGVVPPAASQVATKEPVEEKKVEAVVAPAVVASKPIAVIEESKVAEEVPVPVIQPRFIPASVEDDAAALLAKQARQRDHALELRLLSDRKQRILAAEKARWQEVWKKEEEQRVKDAERRRAEAEAQQKKAAQEAEAARAKQAAQEAEQARLAAQNKAAAGATVPASAGKPASASGVAIPGAAAASSSSSSLAALPTAAERAAKAEADKKKALEDARVKREAQEKKELAQMMRDCDSLCGGTSVWKVSKGFLASPRKVTLTLLKLKEISLSGRASLERGMKDGGFGVSWGSKKSKREDTIFSLTPSSLEIYEGQSHGAFPSKLKDVRKRCGNNREQWSFTIKNHARELDIVTTSQGDYDRWIKFLRAVRAQR